MATPDPGFFDSEIDARDFVLIHLAERLAADGLAEVELRQLPILEGLIDRTEIAGAPSVSSASPALVHRFHWVIRTDDLRLVDLVVDAMVKLFGAGLLFVAIPSAAPAVAVATIVGEGVKLLSRAREKGARLDPPTFLLLTTLRANGPMTAEDLAILLHAIDLSWTREATDATLRRLLTYPARDGSALALVADDSGTWRTTSV
jgi:hypothetical protein